MPAAPLLFVYGSLRCAADFPEARMLAAGADHLGSATAAGRLYRIGWYPGMVASDDPAERVAGDLFALSDPALLAALDAYEGCGPSDPVPHEYRRARILVESDAGPVEAWAYLFAHPLDDHPRITGGDFLADPEPRDGGGV